MAITWKKLAQFNAEGTRIEGDITGKALGGVAGVIPLANGGTNADMSQGATPGVILSSDGDKMTYTAAPTGPGQIMVSNGSNSWTWMGIEDSHNHDSSYINIANNDQQTIAGSLVVDGALEVTGAVTFNAFDEIAVATVNNGILGLGSGDGNNSGFFIDADTSGTFGAGDPCLVWDANYEGTDQGTWVGGKYDDQRALMVFNQGISPTATPDIPGMFGADSGGALYISLKTS